MLRFNHCQLTVIDSIFWFTNNKKGIVEIKNANFTDLVVFNINCGFEVLSRGKQIKVIVIIKKVVMSSCVVMLTPAWCLANQKCMSVPWN